MTAAIIGLGGCANPAQNKKRAADALQEKYQEEFEVTSYKEGTIFQDYYTVQAYSTEYPDLLFQATVDNESGYVMDPYVTKRLCARISEQISENIGMLESDYYVFTEAMLGDTVLSNPEISLEEYQKEEPGNRFTIYLCINRKDCSLDNVTSSLINLMKGIPGVNGSLCLYLPDAELLEKIQEYVTSHDDTYSDFDEMTEEAYIGSVEFENSGFVLTAENLKKMAGDLL